MKRKATKTAEIEHDVAKQEVRTPEARRAYWEGHYDSAIADTRAALRRVLRMLGSLPGFDASLNETIPAADEAIAALSRLRGAGYNLRIEEEKAAAGRAA